MNRPCCPDNNRPRRARPKSKVGKARYLFIGGPWHGKIKGAPEPIGVIVLQHMHLNERVETRYKPYTFRHKNKVWLYYSCRQPVTEDEHADVRNRTKPHTEGK